MFFATLLTSTLLSANTVLAGRVKAAVRQADPHVGDFRTFGVAGCSAQNQGVYTELQSNLGVCQTFGAPVGSLEIVDLNDGCTLYVFADTACSELRVALDGDSFCYNDDVAQPNSYMVYCDQSA